MTAPANKRRTGNELRDRVYREQGLPPPGKGETTRKSKVGRRLARLRRRKG
jgi:hypothetical protein